MSTPKVAPIVAEMVVANGTVKLVDEFTFRQVAKHRAKKWGEGVVLTCRIEPQEEASKHRHYKHLFGHLLTPASDLTGYTVTELKDEMKARFLPDGMTSLTDMNAEQFDEFNRSVEQCIREEYPEDAWGACLNAMALYEQRRTA